MPYALPADVGVLLQKETLTTAESNMIAARIGQAERIILRRIPDLATRISNGEITADDVKDVVVAAVLRVIRNPEGYLSESDGTYSYMLDNSTVGTDIEITDAEWAILGEDTNLGISWLVPVFRAPA